MSDRPIADRVAGGMFVVLGLMSLLEGWRLYPLRRGVVGDQTFPLVLGVVMVGLGASLALFPPPAKKRPTWPEKAEAILMAEGAGFLVLYWIVLPFLGFPVATFIAASGLFATISRFRWYTCLFSAVILTSFFYAMFIAWLGMPFPIGIFGI